LVARWFFLGLTLGVSSLASLGLSAFSAAHAAHPVWSSYSAQAKRPQFRPWSRASRKSAGLRWRPQPEAAAVASSSGLLIDSRMAGRSNARGTKHPMFSVGRTRKAGPLDSRWGLDTRFRPDQRRYAYGLLPGTGEQDRAHERYQVRLHSQFRPTEARRKQTYEQMQSGIVSARRMGTPHWAIAASEMRGYGRHTPGW
jgi:hypothetical protein